MPTPYHINSWTPLECHSAGREARASTLPLQNQLAFPNSYRFGIIIEYPFYYNDIKLLLNRTVLRYEVHVVMRSG